MEYPNLKVEETWQDGNAAEPRPPSSRPGTGSGEVASTELYE